MKYLTAYQQTKSKIIFKNPVTFSDFNCLVYKPKPIFLKSYFEVMMKTLLLLFCLATSSAFAFDIKDYYKFVEENPDLTPQQLKELYPAGEFVDDLNINLNEVYYFDSVNTIYKFTEPELKLLSKNGFLVSDRFKKGEPVNPYLDVFKQDLPVYVSADLILHGIDRGFEYKLIETEKNCVTPIIEYIIEMMRNNISKLQETGFESTEDSLLYSQAYNDAHLFLKISSSLFAQRPNNILGDDSLANAIYDDIINASNFSGLWEVFTNVESEDFPFDFSQFKVRGFYEREQMHSFFRALMWLGRVELFITNVKNDRIVISKRQLQRMTIHAAILSFLLRELEPKDQHLYQSTDSIYKMLIGRQDNVTPLELLKIMDSLDIKSPKELLNQNKLDELILALENFEEGHQKYFGNMFGERNGEDVGKQPIIFKFFGNRPIVDGFITGNLVFDRIRSKDGVAIKRFEPNSLDVAFSLGSNPSLQLLTEELTKYKYSRNLGGMRYMVDNFSPEFWKSSVYAAWLNVIRSLSINDENERNKLPKFAQTAGWHQKTLTSQMSSWARLRRNFILSAKQPYTGSYVCSYPYSTVEPNLKFFDALDSFYETLIKIADFEIESSALSFTRPLAIFNETFTRELLSKLRTIAEKQIKHLELDEEEIQLLKDMLIPHQVCSSFEYTGDPCTPTSYNGWLFTFNPGINDAVYEIEKLSSDYIVADYHTTPEYFQTPVGWVYHAGTGPFYKCFVIREDKYKNKMIYVGVVSSFFEYRTDDYERFTDSDWKQFFEDSNGEGLVPPAFSRYYMADNNGLEFPQSEHFDLKEWNSAETEKKNEITKLNIFPNPAKDYVFLQLHSTEFSGNSTVNLYDISGRLLKTETINVQVNFNNIYKFDLQGIESKGIHLVEIINEVNGLSFSFIKE